MTRKGTFSLGNKVAIIDADELSEEWAEFVIISRFFNRYCLASLDKYTGNTFWVKGNEICLVIQELNAHCS